MSLASRFIAGVSSFKLLAGSLLWLLVCAGPSLAQRPYTIEKPRERSATERVQVSRRATQASKGILAVVLQPVIAGKIVITDAQGREIEQAEASRASGQAEFELRRGATYIIKVSSPGYLALETKAKVLKGVEIVRLSMTAQSANLILPGLPPKAEILIDDKLRATADETGFAQLADLTPGQHTLVIRHPEYNDYKVSLDELKAGQQVSFPPLRSLLSKVARLRVQCLPGASVLIDGEFQGRVNADGVVRIDYQLEQAAEYTIAVELPGYQPWSAKETLTPGPRSLEIKLNPIVTSAGTTDPFDSLSQWSAPPDWKIARAKIKEFNTSRLQVSGPQPGLLKGKTYRDFKALFTVWFNEGQGATWIVRFDSHGPNYYLFHLAGPRAKGLTPRKLYTYRVKNGQITEAQPPISLTFDLKDADDYTVEITVRGHEISHKFTSNATGEESFARFTDELTDKEAFLFGTVGFLAHQGEIFQVDDFSIEPLKPEGSQ